MEKQHPDKVRLCAEMLVYAAFAEQTKDLTGAQLKEALLIFFDTETISQALLKVAQTVPRYFDG